MLKQGMGISEISRRAGVCRQLFILKKIKEKEESDYFKNDDLDF
ncbi:hypothetical protein EfmAA290_18530 [Enterococcus faecium]|nr:hypothetical protein EfmAA290_18530 [Enterococcus faecium]